MGNIEIRRMYMSAIVTLLLVFCMRCISVQAVENGVTNSPSSNDIDDSTTSKTNNSNRYHVVTVNFPYVAVPYVICLWILLASVAKIGFHLYDKLPHIFPESCLLIVLGVIVGLTLRFTETASTQQYTLDANIFFLFLLPPIVFDTGYHIPNRPLFNNAGTILVLAVVNTLWNTFGIGVGLWGMSYLGWIDRKIGIFNCCVFGALISAVDPVAVLAIFEEIQVNEILYIIVFGESLFNDGVTVVMYRMMVGFTTIGESSLQLVDYAAGFAQFWTVVVGGTLIGVIIGIIGVVVTKYTDHVRILEPLFIFVISYVGYLSSEIIGLSSILALTFSGIILRHYSEINMAKKSATTVRYFSKMMATISETIIFMFLGLSTVTDAHDFELDFILFSIFYCLFFRITGVVILSYFMNQRRLIRLTAIDQFIMSYGGLRGGVAFCLALLLDKTAVPERGLFVTTTTVIIYFTVFIQGVTIKPIVNALKVEKAGEKAPSMNEIIHKRFMDHLMAGVEDIVGKSGHNSWFHKIDYYNTKYLKPFLLREKPKILNPSIIRTFNKLSVQDAKASVVITQDMPRVSSVSRLVSQSPSTANLFSRRATIAVPNAKNYTTIVNLHSSDPSFARWTEDDLAMQRMLQESMFEPRSSWAQERRHTLAEIHKSEHGHFRHQADDVNRWNTGEGNKFDDDVGNGNLSIKNFKKDRKVVSFSGSSGMDLSSVEESIAQESACCNEDSLVSQVVFNLSLPVTSGSTKIDSAILKESKKTPCQISIASTNTVSGNHINDTLSSMFIQPVSNGDIVYTDNNNSVSQAEPKEAMSTNPNISAFGTGSKDKASDVMGKAETLAETSLPWRRQTSLPPVSSSVCSSLPDDENPLMSEAPSWADNLAYSHLTETGSPYHSPQNTITGRPAEASHRPVFELFPPCSPQPCSNAASSIPPPWSVKDRNAGRQDDEPLPSQSVTGSDAGDKASCLLISSHDLVPPSYHSCLQPTLNGLDSFSSRRHSDVGSPIHFQLMQKPEMLSAGALESQLIGIEEDYHHGMADRVSQWLANSDNGDTYPDDIDYELASRVESQRILDSLRQKKRWDLEDSDNGTDADVESDDEVFDTKL